LFDNGCQLQLSGVSLYRPAFARSAFILSSFAPVRRARRPLSALGAIEANDSHLDGTNVKFRASI